jgi:hypothetical protein
MVFSMAIFFEMDDFNREDKKYMNIALSLARKGRFDVAQTLWSEQSLSKTAKS